MNVLTHNPEALRSRVLGLAKAVRDQDEGLLDSAAGKDRVKLSGTDIRLDKDRLYSAKAEFDEDGFTKLKLATRHYEGLTGDFQASVVRDGSKESYVLTQDGQHGVGTFRAKFDYDNEQGTFSQVSIKDGPLNGWTKALESAASPIPYLAVGGGALTGFLSAALVGAGPGATLGFCGAGVLMTSALALVGAVGEGYLFNDYK